MLVKVVVVRGGLVKHECCEALDSEVDLVFVKVVAPASEDKVRPVGKLDTVLVAVVVNNFEAIAENLGVEAGIQCVPTHAQSAEDARIFRGIGGAGELFVSQIF